MEVATGCAFADDRCRVDSHAAADASRGQEPGDECPTIAAIDGDVPAQRCRLIDG
jgi:hypothetical protein